MQTLILFILVLIECGFSVYILEREEVIHPIARVTDFVDRQRNGIKDEDNSEVDDLQIQKLAEEEEKAKEEEERKRHEKMDENKKKLDNEFRTDYDNMEIDDVIAKDIGDYRNIKW